MAIHATPFPGAGQTYTWLSQTFVAEDWWDRVCGEPWASSAYNPAALTYAMRVMSGTTIPTDDEVVYGKVGPIGHLVHVSELKARAQ